MKNKNLIKVKFRMPKNYIYSDYAGKIRNLQFESYADFKWWVKWWIGCKIYDLDIKVLKVGNKILIAE